MTVPGVSDLAGEAILCQPAKAAEISEWRLEILSRHAAAERKTGGLNPCSGLNFFKAKNLEGIG
jgi:hypothetical protein